MVATRLRTGRASIAAALAMLWLTSPPAIAVGSALPTPDPMCTVDGAGSPSCTAGDAGAAPGSAVDPNGAAIHRGNPVEVRGGNKYQRETDYRAFGTGLAFVRHYNSLRADEDLGLGHGWRHTYQVFLAAIEGGGLRLYQSDGRVVDFAAVAGTTTPTVHRAASAADGLIVHGAGRSSWYLPDGRRLDFVGRFLARIDFGDARGALELEYADRRVARVRDRLGRELVFLYVARSQALPTWGERDVYLPPGSLRAVVLPDGTKVRFAQDAGRRLTSVAYPDGSAVEYGNDDPGWRTGQLTSRRTVPANDPHAATETRWRYDDDGRAAGMSGAREMRVERAFDGPHSGVATVRWGNGRTESIAWPRAPGETVTSDSRAAPRTRARNAEAVRLDAAVGAALAAVRTVEDDPNTLVTTLPLPGGPAALWMRTDRHGGLRPTWLGATSLESVLARAAAGELPTCDGSAPGASAIDLFGSPSARLRGMPVTTRLGELAAGAPACADDVAAAFALEDALRRGQTDGTPIPETVPEPPVRIAPPDFAPRRAGRPGKRPDPRGPGEIVPIVQGPEPSPCDMPPGKDCAALEEDREMALLSECAYEAGTCGTAWRAVPPGEIGLNDADFHLDGFDAVLYQDPVTKAYTLAFRGTDGVGDDWRANLRQGRGQDTRQYSLAYDLGGKLETALAGKELGYTGHSLGGGLATFAALSTHREATVFNAASVHPATTAREGLEQEYADADTYIDLVTIHDDPVTAVMRTAHNTGAYGLQFTPGRHTVLANPAPAWVDRHFDGGGPIDDRLARHSIAAVIEQLEILLVKHCGATF